MNFDNEFVTIIKGNSMFPMLISDISSIYMTRKFDQLRQNDIIAYKHPIDELHPVEKIRVHRILKTDENDYLVAGDNSLTFESIKEQMVIGVLKGFCRKKKYVDCKNHKGYKIYTLFWCGSMKRRNFLIKYINPLLQKIDKYQIRN
mgnify:CR=1 FL=1